MDVSIIIVNYNTKDVTKQCVDSVFDKTEGVSYEVILVDNASTDGSREMFSNDLRICYLYSHENLGFGRANNLGLKNATGDYVFFLNSDTYLLNNAVKIFYDFYHANEDKYNLGGAGCLLTNKEGKIIHSYSNFPSIKKDVLYQLGVVREVVKFENISCQIHVVDYVTGADLFVNRKVLESLGAFDPDFFMYFEETEMQYRWYKNRLNNVIIDGPKIVHLHGGSQQGDMPINRMIIQTRSKVLFFKKTNGIIIFEFYRLLLLIFSILLFFKRKYSFNQILKYLSYSILLK